MPATFTAPSRQPGHDIFRHSDVVDLVIASATLRASEKAGVLALHLGASTLRQGRLISAGRGLSDWSPQGGATRRVRFVLQPEPANDDPLEFTMPRLSHRSIRIATAFAIAASALTPAAASATPEHRPEHRIWERIRGLQRRGLHGLERLDDQRHRLRVDLHPNRTWSQAAVVARRLGSSRLLRPMVSRHSEPQACATSAITCADGARRSRYWSRTNPPGAWSEPSQCG